MKPRRHTSHAEPKTRPQPRVTGPGVLLMLGLVMLGVGPACTEPVTVPEGANRDCENDDDCDGSQICVVDPEDRSPDNMPFVCACRMGSNNAQCAESADCRENGLGTTCSAECQCIDDSQPASTTASTGSDTTQTTTTSESTTTADSTSDGPSTSDGASSSGGSETGGSLVCVAEMEPNNSDMEAQELGPLSQGEALCVDAGCDDPQGGDSDFYEIQVQGPGMLRVEGSNCDNVDQLSGIELFNASGEFLLGTSDDMCGNNEVVYPVTEAATFFVRVPCDAIIGETGTHRVTIALD